ncbi:MAG: translocase [Sandaracinus sp.]|nr:translocase [Sandaracinus sp.]|tara:strand:- start:1107 stop:2492 length:1386 start_codon:yes stop_codon:yes gene_type:complete
MTDDEKRPGLVDRALRVFADVRAGEGTSTLILAFSIFLLMVSYYVIKVVREPWILTMGEDGAQLKAYASAVQAAALMFYVPAFTWFSGKFPSQKLVFFVVGFFLVCIQLFWVGSQGEVAWLGFVFFVWVGIFSVSVIALFWSFANDAYTQEKGERLFPIVTVGMTAGPVVGSKLSEYLVDSGMVGVYDMLQVAAAMLLVHGVLYAVLVRRDDIELEANDDGDSSFAAAFKGFRLVFENGYIRWIAVLLILLNLVNTTGEYILSVYAKEQAAEALAAAGQVADEGAFTADFIGSFYADFFFYVNVAAVTLQALVASRLVKYLGIAGVILPLPILALGNYALLAFGMGFVVFRWMKTAENSSDYSLMNNAKAMLWLPTSREEKYSAKQAVDTFFVRLGDLTSAGIIYLGTEIWEFGKTGFAYVNVGVILVWLGVAWILVRAYKTRSAEHEEEQAEETGEPVEA